INWGIGTDYKSIRKKKDKFYFKPDESDYELSEYRVDKVHSIEITLGDRSRFTDSSSIILADDKYELIDKTGDGFNDTIALNLPEQKNLSQGSKVEITYDYSYDEKRNIKRSILNTLRIITLVIVAGNFIMSFVKFGSIFFWI
ncbi:MAG: hypothetical protein ACFFE4_22990, partial [Candidatus Thorarchaeota archaeon]